MAKISNTNTYPTKASPSSTDYVIGTDASSKETKTFTLQSIANLYGGSGSGTVTSVGLDGGTTGITITSDTTNPITTTGTFTLGGTLAVANGGTGLTSLAEGSILIGDSSSSISSLTLGADTYVLTSNGITASWQAPEGGISVKDSGGTAISGINTLNFDKNLSVGHAAGSTTVTIDGPSSANGISPFPIYQAKDSVAVGGQTIIRQSVCETAGTYSRLDYFSVGASSNPVYFAIYTGTITAAGSATKRLEGSNSTSSAGINVINFSSSYNFTAGQDIVIIVSADDTLGLAGSTSLLSHADICRGAAVYTSSFPSTLGILLDGITNPVATGVCTHIY